MLVLSRKTGQELVIDGRIRVIVQRISGNRVTLGISAPDDVSIRRGELEPLPRETARDARDEARLAAWTASCTPVLSELERQIQ
jgi:carbon storage regulator